MRKSQINLISTCCDTFYELWMSLWNLTGYFNIDWTSKHRWCKRNLLEPVTEMISCTLLNIMSARITANSAATVRSHYTVALDSFVEIKSLDYLVMMYFFDFHFGFTCTITWTQHKWTQPLMWSVTIWVTWTYGRLGWGGGEIAPCISQ